MEIAALEEKNNRFVFDLPGGGHTICNTLKHQLWATKGVKVATYHIGHPLKDIPQFTVETDGSLTPKDAIKEAIKQLQKHNKEFITLVNQL